MSKRHKQKARTRREKQMERQAEKEKSEAERILLARDGLQPVSEPLDNEPLDSWPPVVALDPVSQMPIQPPDSSPATVPTAAPTRGNGSPPRHPTKRRDYAAAVSNSVVEPEIGVISVNNCALCGGSHYRAPYRPLSQPLGLFTHFYTCEENNEPVPISIVSFDGKTLEIPQAVVDRLCRAILDGKWVFMACGITNVRKTENGDGERCDFDVQWVTHNVPRYVLLDIAAKFADDMRKELDPMADKKIQVEPGPPIDVKKLFRARNG